MAVLDGRQEALEEGPRFLFFEMPQFQNAIKQLAAVTHLHADVVPLFGFEVIVLLDDVRMLERFLIKQRVDETWQVLYGPLVDDLQGYPSA